MSTPQWKLRRLARRAQRVVERRGPESPVVGAYAATLSPKVDAFVAAYDAAAQHESIWKKELEEGRSAIDALLGAMRGWLPLLTRDLAGFSASDFGDNPGVPDDVIEDAERLLATLDDRGGDLVYAEQASAQLEPLLAAAITEWQEADATDRNHQRVLESSRTAAATLNDELKSFRRTLAAVFGRKDRDYPRRKGIGRGRRRR